MKNKGYITLLSFKFWRNAIYIHNTFIANFKWQITINEKKIIISMIGLN